jgi:hypothetical protein
LSSQACVLQDLQRAFDALRGEGGPTGEPGACIGCVWAGDSGMPLASRQSSSLFGAPMISDARILVTIDPTAKRHPALERARWLAPRAGAKLELFACRYDQYLAADTKAIDSQLHHDREWMQQLAAPLTAQGLDVVVDIR